MTSVVVIKRPEGTVPSLLADQLYASVFSLVLDSTGWEPKVLAQWNFWGQSKMPVLPTFCLLRNPHAWSGMPAAFANVILCQLRTLGLLTY